MESLCHLITDGKHGDCQAEDSSGYYFISSKDVNDQKINYENARQITFDDFQDTHRRTQLEPLDILITNSGTIGRMAIVKDNRLTARTTFQKSVAILKPNKEKVITYWLYYYLQSNIDRLISYAGGTAQKNLLLRDLRAFDVELPALNTQGNIASILSTYDDLIENNTRRIKILEEMARLIYHEWFVEWNIPVETSRRGVSNKTRKSETPEPGVSTKNKIRLRKATPEEKKVTGKDVFPEGWEIERLSELVNPQYGYTESASEKVIGPKYLRGMDINKSSFISWDSVPYCKISDEDAKKYQLEFGDIVIIRMADPGKVGIIEKNIDAIFASYLIRLKIVDRRLTPYYLFYYLISDRYHNYITGASTGTTRKSASAPVVTGIDFVMPPRTLLDNYELLIGSVRKELNCLLDVNANLRQTRDLLLPKLISGEVEV